MPLGRRILLAAAFCGYAWSQTGLTTIQDTLFEADGTRFNGTLAIQWSTFDTTNPGTVVQQSKTVQVINGNLDTQLVPNSGAQPPANVYTIEYQSDGFQQFAETWSVPASTQPLKVSQVRVGSVAVTTTGGTGSVGSQTPIPESNIVGLQADLSERPIRGAGYGTNGVAVVDDIGALETAVGNVGDCVLVDGTTGPCGAPPVYSDGETPGGSIDGSNGAFTLANTPLGTSLMVFRNGVYLTTGGDYTLSGSTIQFVSGAIPQPGDVLTASYRVDPSTIVTNAAPLALPRGSGRLATAQVICSAAGAVTKATAWSTLGSCDVPAGALKPGDRIEVQFTFAHTGTSSGFDLQVNWGKTPVVARHGFVKDSAVTGRADSAIAANGAQISIESWGTVLPFLPAILKSPAQPGICIELRGRMGISGNDSITLTNYTVLRFPAN